MKFYSWPLSLARVACMIQGMPAVLGVLDKVVSWTREVWRGRSVSSTRDKGQREGGGQSRCSATELGKSLGGLDLEERKGEGLQSILLLLWLESI